MGYYGMIQPHLKRNELMHGRTKGSRNGVSNTPGYVATGKRAVGRRLPDGTYVYDQPGVPNAYDQQRIAAAETQSAIRGMPGNQNTQRMLNQYGPQNYQQKSAPATSAPAQDNRNPFHRAGDWLGARGRDISSAVGQAGQAIGNAAGNVASAYTNSPVGQAIVGAVDQAGRWAGGMADRLGGAARGAGQFITDRWNNLGQAANEWGGGLARTAKGAARKVREAGTSAGNWLTERGREAGQAIGSAARGAGQAIGTAAGRAGEAIRNAANQAGEFITGNQSRANLDRAAEAYINAEKLRDATTQIGNIGGHRGAYGKIGELGENLRRYTGEHVYRDAKDAYDRTLPGMLDNVGGDVGYLTGEAGKWLNEHVGRPVNRALYTARDAIGGAAKNAGQAIGATANQAGEFITGNQSRAKMQGGEAGRKAANVAAGVNNIANPSDRGGVGNRIEESGRRADELYREGAEEYGRTLPGMVENSARGAANSFTGNDIKPQVDAAAKTVSKNQQAADQAKKIMDDANRELATIKLGMDNYRDRYEYEKAYSSPDVERFKDLYEQANKAYDYKRREFNDARDKYEAAVKTLTNSINDYESISGEYNSRPGVAINTTIGNIKSAGEGAMTNAQNFIGNMFGGNKKKKK